MERLHSEIAVRKGKKVYRDGDVVIKLFDNDYSKSGILNEALNQSRVEETGLEVPKILEVTKIDGKWAIVMEYIAGKTLAEHMKENPERIDDYLDRFVNLQLKMHLKQAPLLNRLKDKMERKINEAGFDESVAYELQTRLAAMPKHAKLCHGDFNPNNIIVGDDGVDYIIDWSHATQGNASADVARSYLLFMLAGEEEIAEKYLELFSEKSGTDRQYIYKWFPIVAASQSVKGKPEEREFLLKWIDIIDFQ